MPGLVHLLQLDHRTVHSEEIVQEVVILMSGQGRGVGDGSQELGQG